jgi:PAS domain S-box-containing protein
MKNIFLIILLVSTFYAKENKKIIVQLSWLNQFQFAGYFMAKELGYYNDIGIDVEIKEYTNSLNNVEEIEQGRAHFAIGRSNILIDKANGKDVVALGAIFQNSPLMLLVMKENNINTIDDLKNKKIMITSDAKNSASIMAMLNSRGINKKNIFMQKHSFNVDDLINGKTDAMGSYLSNEPIQLKDKNVEYKIFHPKSYGFDFYDDILFTSSKFIKNNPKLTKDFYYATLKGWEYAYKNVIKTAELIYKKYNTQNKSLIHLIKEGEILKKISYQKNGEVGYLEKEKLQNIVDIYKTLGLVQRDVNLDEFIYKENNHKSFKFDIRQDQLYFIPVILGLLFIIIFGLVFYLVVKNRWLLTKDELYKQIELKTAKLNESKEFLNLVINETDDLIFYKDEKLRYMGCNKAFEKFINKTNDVIAGKTDFELIDLKTANIFRANDEKVLESDSSKISDDWHKYPDGRNLLMQTSKKQFHYELNKIGILGISRDITELNKLKDDQLKQQKLFLVQSKISAVGEMLANIAHQWRQPLSIISMHASNLKMRVEFEEDISTEQLIKCVDGVVYQAKYLSDTIDDFRNFFKTNDDSTFKSYDVKKIFLEIEKLTQDSLRKNFIKLIKNFDNDVTINTNEHMIIQSFIVMFNNSVDAFLKQNIDTENRYIFLNVKKHTDHLLISFEDSAGGIEPSIIDKIYEPYFTTKHSSVGIGIGLYMTNQIITKQLNGTISVENCDYVYDDKELRGTKFIITLPFDE